jgi:hypothetical protein
LRFHQQFQNDQQSALDTLAQGKSARSGEFIQVGDQPGDESMANLNSLGTVIR